MAWIEIFKCFTPHYQHFENKNKFLFCVIFTDILTDIFTGKKWSQNKSTILVMCDHKCMVLIPHYAMVSMGYQPYQKHLSESSPHIAWSPESLSLETFLVDWISKKVVLDSSQLKSAILWAIIVSFSNTQLCVMLSCATSRSFIKFFCMIGRWTTFLVAKFESLMWPKVITQGAQIRWRLTGTFYILPISS